MCLDGRTRWCMVGFVATEWATLTWKGVTMEQEEVGIFNIYKDRWQRQYSILSSRHSMHTLFAAVIRRKNKHITATTTA